MSAADGSRAPLRRALGLCLLAGRGALCANVALVMAQGLVPLAGLWAMRWLVDAVAAGAARDPAAALPGVLAAVAAAAAVALSGLVLRGVSGWVGEAHGRAVTDACVDMIHRHAVTLDLAQGDDPRHHDLLHRAGQEALQRPARFLQDLAGLGVACVTLLAMGGALVAVHPLLPFLVAACALPAVRVRLRHAREQLAWQEESATAQREAGYLSGLLTGRGLAKEVRAFGLGEWLAGRFAAVRDGLRARSLQLSARRARGELAAQALATAALFAAYAWLGWKALLGALTVGAFVMYAQAVQRAQNGVRDLLGAWAGLVEDRLFLRQFFAFLDQRPALVPDAPVPLPTGPAPLSCAGVEFTYPGAAAPALRGLTLAIAPGERLAIVGRNGSGKSTLVKLLARLYAPGAGTIEYGGVDLRAVDPAAWRQRVAVLFQDAQPLELTVRDNIRAGAPGRDDAAAIERAARFAGVHERILQLPQGYDTLLSRRLGAGAELSAGEWRKVLLARAIYRDTEVLVLDEPSAFLDPSAEQELLACLRAGSAARTIVVVDHRPAAARWADRVCVMDAGRIVESGSHAELVRRPGPFLRLTAVAGESAHDPTD